MFAYGWKKKSYFNHVDTHFWKWPYTPLCTLVKQFSSRYLGAGISRDLSYHHCLTFGDQADTLVCLLCLIARNIFINFYVFEIVITVHFSTSSLNILSPVNIARCTKFISSWHIWQHKCKYWMVINQELFQNATQIWTWIWRV